MVILGLSIYQFYLNEEIKSLNDNISKLETSLIVKEQEHEAEVFEKEQEIIFEKEKENFDAEEHFINTDVGEHTISF